MSLKQQLIAELAAAKETKIMDQIETAKLLASNYRAAKAFANDAQTRKRERIYEARMERISARAIQLGIWTEFLNALRGVN
jgi:hypothetical protein